ncbi:MAG: IS66 family transposase [Solirubrobacterales bacterium]|nr:IS66 family transposase [Solirubrobacterales bacterium]
MDRAEAEAIYDQGRESVVAVLLRMDEQIQQLTKQVAKQGEQIAELQRRLNRNSQNSSAPPSQDPPGAPERKRPDPSGRAQGAQPGHPGRGRKLLPAEAVDRMVEHWPGRCGCGHRFADGDEEAGRPARHQVTELPEIAVEVTEHRLHRRRCPDCGAAPRAELPDEVPAGAFGPRMEAAVATLAVRNRVSRRDTVELASELFGAKLASGTVDAILARAGQALADPYEDLLAQVRAAPALNVDETGWKLRGKRRTLWGAVTPKAAVFRIAPDRHEREAIALLGEDFEGIVGSDRWWAYRGFDPAKRQVCWSHLIRDLTAHAEGLAAQKRFGEVGLDIARRLFVAWDDFGERGDRRALKRELAPLKRELKALLQRGSKGRRNKLTWGISKNLLKIWPALWTFAEVEGVEPTNNVAERALRGPVIYRKLSLGSQSERGEHTIERLLSASVTCRLQGRSLFAYLADVLGARARGDPAPLLA